MLQADGMMDKLEEIKQKLVPPHHREEWNDEEVFWLISKVERLERELAEKEVLLDEWTEKALTTIEQLARLREAAREAVKFCEDIAPDGMPFNAELAKKLQQALICKLVEKRARA